MTEKKVKYTPEDNARVVSMRRAGASLAEIAASFPASNPKNEKQIRAKLVSLKEYKASDADAKPVSVKPDGPTKDALLKIMADLGFEVKAFEGTRKDGLQAVINRLTAEPVADESEADAEDMQEAA